MPARKPTKKTTPKKDTKKSPKKTAKKAVNKPAKKVTSKKATPKKSATKKTAKKVAKKSTKKTSTKRAVKKKTVPTRERTVVKPALKPQTHKPKDAEIQDALKEMQEKAHAATVHAKYKLIDAKDNVEKGYRRSEDWVKKNPGKAVFGAAALGWVASRLFRRKKK